MITVTYNDVEKMYNATLVDFAGEEHFSDANPKSIIETGRINFPFTSVQKVNQETVDNATLSFIFENGKVTGIYFNDEYANFQIYDNTEDACDTYNMAVEQALQTAKKQAALA